MNKQQLVQIFKASTKTKIFGIFKHFSHLVFVVLAFLCVIVHADLNIKSLIFFAYPYVGCVTAIYAWIFLSHSFMRDAYFAVKTKSLNYEFLLVFSAISSFLVSTILWIIYGNDLSKSSYYSAHQKTVVFTFYEAVTLIFYFAYVGTIVAKLTTKQTNLEINKIQKLQPSKVRIKNQDQFIVKNINALKIDDVILILKGETIPADGILLSEKALLQAKLITGDAKASEYTKTCQLFAGMINYGNEILVQTKALSSKSFISQLIYRLENFQKPKVGVFSFINKYVNKFFTFELIIAFVFFCIWTVVAVIKADQRGGFNDTIFAYYFIHKAIFSTISLFTAICPCALGMAIPLIYLLTSLKGQRKNIIFCNLNFFNKYKKIKTFAFDKTGTISTTELKIANLSSKDLSYYLKILISLEERSNHPIAQSLVNNNKGVARVKISNVKELVGAGIEGLFQNKQILVASRKYILFHFSNLKNLDSYQQQQLLIVDNEVVLGFDLIYDYDPRTINMIKTLQKQHYKTLLLTGDQHLVRNHPLRRIFQKENIFYNLTPEDKVKILNKLRNEDKVKILYVGDGLNDVNVFQEGCDIAIGLGNAHVAIKAISDVVFIDNDLSNLSFLWKLVNRNQLFIKFCFSWFLIYNLAIFFITGFALISPSLGSGIMMISDLILLLVVLVYRFWRIK